MGNYCFKIRKSPEKQKTEIIKKKKIIQVKAKINKPAPVLHQLDENKLYLNRQRGQKQENLLVTEGNDENESTIFQKITNLKENNLQIKTLEIVKKNYR